MHDAALAISSISRAAGPQPGLLKLANKNARVRMESNQQAAKTRGRLACLESHPRGLGTGRLCKLYSF